MTNQNNKKTFSILFLVCLFSFLKISCVAKESNQNFLNLKGNITKNQLLIAKSGCCSWHHGVCGCRGGRVVCCDGTLSPTCTCLMQSHIFDNPKNTLISSSFHGYPCTGNCSGHEAGYEWAEENDITDPSDCDGNSNSFIEGCEAYAEEYDDENNEDE